MTVSSSIAKSGPYTANGVTTVFNRGFLILDASHLRVVQTIDGVSTDITTGFSQSGVGSTSGSITFTTAPATGTITLLRNVPNEQQSDYSSQASVDPATIEQDLDLLAMQIQDISVEISDVFGLTVSQFLSGIPNTTLQTLIDGAIAVWGWEDDAPATFGSDDDATIQWVSADSALAIGVGGSTVLEVDAAGVTVTGLVSGTTIGGAMVSTDMLADKGSTTKIPCVEQVLKHACVARAVFTGANPPVILESIGIDSIVRSATGTYDITLENTMASAYYSVNPSVEGGFGKVPYSVNTTTTCRVITEDSGGTNINASFISVTIFGELA